MNLLFPCYCLIFFVRKRETCQYNYFPRGVKQIKEAEILTNFQSIVLEFVSNYYYYYFFIYLFILIFFTGMDIVLKFVSNFFSFEKMSKRDLPSGPSEKDVRIDRTLWFFLFTKTIFLWFVWKNETFESM
jgi:hypothetical protein